MPTIHLIRHGRPLIGERPRTEWPLDPAHTADIDSLGNAGVVPDDAFWFTSAERKAIETAERLGHPEATIMPELHEQKRPSELVEDLSGCIARSLAEPDRPPLLGWESARATEARLISAIALILDERGPVVLVGHGFAWTLLSAQLTGSQPNIEMWRSVRMPDHCRIEDGSFSSGWGEWANSSSP